MNINLTPQTTALGLALFLRLFLLQKQRQAVKRPIDLLCYIFYTRLMEPINIQNRTSPNNEITNKIDNLIKPD